MSWNYPLKTANQELGLVGALRENYVKGTSMFLDTHPSEVKDGFSLTFHEPFEIISKSSTTFNSLGNQTVIFWIVPQLLTYDDTITSFDSEKYYVNF